MDSGNSGSMQSSSGGDDESYDSRAESISALLGPATTNHHQPPPPQHHQQQQHRHQHHNPHVEFDSLSNIFDSRLMTNPNPNPNPLLNLDMVWSTKTLRSDPGGMADLGGDLSQPFLTASQLGGGGGGGGGQQVSRGGAAGVGPSANFAHHHHHHHHHQIPSSSSSAPIDQTTTVNNNNNNNNVGGVRSSNPKKRSRASRRAPTTVLTTDTTNFRAMVQEFTGIPAPPFTSSSPFPPSRTRLDLFGSSMLRSGPGPGPMDPNSSLPPPYLSRPFPPKAPLLPPPPSSSLLPSSHSNTNTNLLNMQNSCSSLLNFPSLFQNQQPTLPKYPLPGNVLGSSSSSKSSGGHLLEDQFAPGLSSHGLNVQLPNILLSPSSDGNRTPQQQLQPNNPRTTTTTNWVDSNSKKNDGNAVHLRSGYSSNVVDKAGLVHNVSSTAITTTTTTTAAARSEGMVESWICSSE